MKRSLVIVAFALTAAGLAAPEGHAADAPAPVAIYSVPVRAWMTSTMTYFAKHGLEIQTRWRMPQLWLFDPEGHMVRRVSAANPEAMEKLSREFPSAVSREVLDGQPSLPQARELLAQAFEAASIPQPAAGQWFALLLISSDFRCDSCARFEDAFARMRAQGGGKLVVVKVDLVYPDDARTLPGTTP